MVLVRTLIRRDGSEVGALVRSWTDATPEPEPVPVAQPGVPLVAAQMFGGTSHKVKVRYVSR